MMLLSAFALVLSGPMACKKKPPVEAPNVETPIGPQTDKATGDQDLPEPVKAMVENFGKVFFETDASDLSGGGKAALDANVRLMQEHGDIKVQVQGHADERGTTDYNLALGQRRADAVYKYMSASGVGSSRIQVVSFGEERPAVSGSNTQAWSKNRRCEFVITWGGEGEVKGSTE